MPPRKFSEKLILLATFSKYIYSVIIETLITGTIPSAEKYLDKDLYNILLNCTPAKQRLIYNIAKIVAGSDFV